MRAFCVLIALALAAACPGQKPPPTVACRFCESHGEKDCKKHRKMLELERSVLHCSVAAECKRCAGALSIDCKICANAPVEAAALQRQVETATWLQKRRATIDRYLVARRTVLHGKTEHVDLTFTVRPQTVGRVKCDTHRLMHLYLERIEALRARFLALFEAPETDFSARLAIYMFRDRVDHQELSPRVAGGGSSGTGMKMMGLDATYCMYHDERQMPGDEGLNRAVVHNVTHLLLSNMKPEIWLGNRKHGWVDEGVAHYFEDLITGRCATYCYEEVGVSPGASFKGGKWRVPVRRMVEAGQLEPFAAVSKLNTDQLTGPQHAQVFAYVDFLISSYGGKAFAKMVRLLKKGKPTRDALREAFALGILGFDAAFATWVKAHYPLQKR